MLPCVMRQFLHRLSVSTRGRGLVEVTAPIAKWVGGQNIVTGLLTVFCRHTSASLLIQENADPDVRADLEAFFGKLVPEGPGSTAMRARGRMTCPLTSKRR
jgi:secondary thiamine-phosphate synthase enzyme